MNVQCYLILELMHYDYQLGQNTTEATKNTCVKDEDMVDHNTVTRWLKKFHLYCKKLDNKASLKLWILKLCS